jgi:hypothetical protein
VSVEQPPKRLFTIRNKHAITLEWMRMGALKGLVTDGNAPTVSDGWASMRWMVIGSPPVNALPASWNCNMSWPGPLGGTNDSTSGTGDPTAQQAGAAANASSSTIAMDSGSGAQSPTPAGAKKSKAAKSPATSDAAQASSSTTQVASASSRNASRSRSGSDAKGQTRDTAYQAKLRHCVQQPTGQRDSCLDQVIEETQRS